MRRGTDNKQVRSSCMALLRDLDIQPPFSVDEFCERLSERRGIPIRLIEWSLPVPGPFGLWMSRPHEDCIFFQKETTPTHQRHIILHEIGHIVSEHDSDLEPIEPMELGQGLPTGWTWRGLRRTCYSEAYEREAEEVASTILEWAEAVDRIIPPLSSSRFESLYRSLNTRRGWL